MRLLKSKFSIVLSGIGLLIGAAVLFLLFTDQPLVKLLRFTVFNAFEFEGDEVGTVERDIVYKTVAGEPLLVDLYLPFARRHASIPVVVFSHGGGWVMGDRATMLIGPDNKQLILRLRGLGYAVANFEYRLLGETVGPFRLIAELGSGGMGAVYLAEAVRSHAGIPEGARVAVKLVHPRLLEAPGVIRRFLREAQIGKNVRHPNVVQTLDVGLIAKSTSEPVL